MMSTPFLSLVKEEPEGDSDTCRRQIPPLSATHGGHTHPSDAQPMSGMLLNPPGQHGLTRTDSDPGLEPITRARSYTWPQCPDGSMENEETMKLETPLGDRRVPGGGAVGGGLGVIEPPGGGAPKKNTSRRNPWGNMSYADLIAQAILSSPEGRATLSQIYDWMVQNVPYFKDKGDSNSSAGWKNSIRHNLSLHNRFMRMQNEGTGKSSWWVLNPDAKPGKSTRRRANTLEGGRFEKSTKRGRTAKKREAIRTGIEATPSPSSLNEGLDLYPESPMGLHHPQFQMSPQDFRPRVSSNASSCGGRSTPMALVDGDMHDAQVPPVSPNITPWGPTDYWSPQGPHAPHSLVLGHTHDRYPDQLADSMGEHLKLGNGETWGHPHLIPRNPTDCAKLTANGTHPAHVINSHTHHTHHFNGLVTHHHLHHHSHQLPGFNNYEEFGMFSSGQGGGHSITPGFTSHSSLDKINHSRQIQPPYAMPPLQPISPSMRSNHSLSPPNGLPETRFTPQNRETEQSQTPSFCSSPPVLHHQAVQPTPIPSTAQPTLPEHQSPTVAQPPMSTQLSIISSCSVMAASTSSTSSSTHSQLGSSPTSLLHHRVPTTHTHHPNSNHNPHTHSHLPQHHHHFHHSPPEPTTTLKVALSHREAGNSEINQNVPPSSKQGVPGGHLPGACSGGSTDLVDLDAIQEGGPFDCNVDEVIKHELQYEDHDFTFDFPQGQGTLRDPSGHPYYNRGRDGAPQMANGPQAVMQYNRHSIAAVGGNGGTYR